ncbi:unnamed protein product, partial [Closterium sp. NIES-54]
MARPEERGGRVAGGSGEAQAQGQPRDSAMAPMQPSLGPPRDEPRVFGLDKFNGDNFAEWSFKMENIFDHYDLLEVMEGTEKRPENDPEKSPWVRKSAQGYLLLGQALGSSQIRHIKPFQREPEKRPKAWAALRPAAEPPRSRAARQPSRPTAEPPSSRAAQQPSRQTAEPPSSRVAEPPCSRGRAVDFEVWVDDLQLFLQCDRADGLSMFNLTSGASPAPPATADSTVPSQWATRDAAARLAVRRHLPTTERAHFSQYKSAQTLYDAVVARYSSPATAALSRLMLLYLFPDLAAFPTVADLITHLRTSDTRYRAALPA